MFSAEMSVSLIYLCSGRRVPGKQQAQHVWESLSNPERSRRHSPAHWPLQLQSHGKRGEGGILGASDTLGFLWPRAPGQVLARHVRHQQQRHKEGDTGLPPGSARALLHDAEAQLLASVSPCMTSTSALTADSLRDLQKVIYFHFADDFWSQ